MFLKAVFFGTVFSREDNKPEKKSCFSAIVDKSIVKKYVFKYKLNNIPGPMRPKTNAKAVKIINFFSSDLNALR